MRVLQLSMHENSGAGKAALRLHNGLIQDNLDSVVMVLQKSSDLPSVVLPNKWNKLYKRIQPLVVDKFISQLGSHQDDTFSINFTPSSIDRDIKKIKPDLINLHWIGWEFLRIEDFRKLGVPLVWTLHDMWAFTGGCHYSGGCDRYTKSCGTCPQLNSNTDRDLSRWVWQRKHQAWKDLDLTIVTPSRWLAACARASTLCQDLRIEVIPNGLDIQKYQPIDKKQARKLIGLPQDGHIILFGAVGATSSPRKGFQFLKPALQKLCEDPDLDRVELVIFGSSQPLNPPDLGFKVNYLGRLNDDIALALVYAAADVFVAPSVEDNLPNTVIEALACGTPCVSFRIGGMSDPIEHQQNGYLAQPFDTDDLARGIAWVLGDPQRHQKLCDRAREKVEQEFTSELQAHRYTALYQNLVH
jgi:glycosyltransferase involved in cell wall biosynthesis